MSNSNEQQDASPKVFGAIFGTETNSFAPIVTTKSDFAEFGFSMADTPLDPNGALDPLFIFAKAHIENLGGTFTPSMRIYAQPHGPIVEQDYRELRDQLLSDLRAAMPVDIVFLVMHGAMMSENEVDCEGDILERAREIVGPDAIIGVSMDPHAHLTQRMQDRSDIMVFWKEYPHTDSAQRSLELLSLCLKACAGEVTPKTSVYDIRTIHLWPTQEEPVRGFVDSMIELETQSSVLSVSFVHGFPWGDSPDVGGKIVVITDDDDALGDRIAKKLGETVWNMRDDVKMDWVTIDQAIEQASAIPNGPIVMADAADNAGGGAPQDSTFILQRFIERSVSGAAIAGIYDPSSVAKAISAGTGAKIELSIGGKHGDISGDSVAATFEVIGFQKDVTQISFTDTPTPLGDVAWVACNGIDLFLTSVRSQILSTEIFTKLGLDPTSRKILVVKSTNHFYAGFKDIAKETIYVDTPGLLTKDPKRLPYSQLSRPVWPLVANPFEHA